MNFEASNDNTYNNADSFSIAFDAAWKDYEKETDKIISLEEKIEETLKKIETHPFLLDNPIESKNIALFRVKLLGLS